MKKQLFLSLALLTIGSTLQARSFGGGFVAGAATGVGLSAIASRNSDPQVVYIEKDSNSNKDLERRVQELEKENRALKKRNRRNRN